MMPAGAEKLRYGAPNIVGEMTEPGREWLRAQDFRFFPVDVQFGPDGAMYVLDFYNPIVAHSDTDAARSQRPPRGHSGQRARGRARGGAHEFRRVA